MILFSIGLPGRFAEWCDAVIARLVAAQFGPAGLMHADRPEEVAIDLIHATAPHLVIGTRNPAASLRAAIAGRPVLVSRGDPRRSVHELTAMHGADFVAAVREVARSCAAVAVCGAIPGALNVHAGGDPVATIGDIARGLGIAVDDGTLTALAAEMPYPADASGPDRIDAWWAALDPEQRTLGDGALAAYRARFAGHRFGEIVWNRALLWLAADRNRHAGEAIEIGTEARPLVAGPDIGLPPGEWSAAVTLGVSREAAGIGFDIDIVAVSHNDRLARVSAVPDARGICAVTLPFTVAPATGQTIAIGIASTGASAGGRLALGKVTLTPRPEDGADFPSELTEVLGWT